MITGLKNRWAGRHPDLGVIRMRSFAGLAALLTATLLIPSIAEARGYSGKSGTIMSPYGPMYNTGSAEWRQSGGNIFAYEELMERKMMMQEQQMMLKQQQQMMKQQAQKGKPGATTGTTNGNAGAYNDAMVIGPRKKKKRRTYDPTHPVTSQGITEKEKAGTAKAKSDSVKAKSEKQVEKP